MARHRNARDSVLFNSAALGAADHGAHQVAHSGGHRRKFGNTKAMDGRYR